MYVSRGLNDKFLHRSEEPSKFITPWYTGTTCLSLFPQETNLEVELPKFIISDVGHEFSLPRFLSSYKEAWM